MDAVLSVAITKGVITRLSQFENRVGIIVTCCRRGDEQQFLADNMGFMEMVVVPPYI